MSVLAVGEIEPETDMADALSDDGSCVQQEKYDDNPIKPLPRLKRKMF